MCCGTLLVFWHGITNMYLPQPPTLTNNYGQSLDIVSRTSEAVTHALTSDVSWMVSVLNNTHSLDPGPDWSGTLARAAKDDGPLPADLQIYRIILQVKWSNPRHWENIVVRPGGMHTLMSFVGCIGTLMESTGLEDLLNSAFNGITHMLNGKAWPKAVRGLSILVLAIIKPLVTAIKTTMTELAEELGKIGQVSRTGRLWVECLIMPVMIIHIYLRAERTGD